MQSFSLVTIGAFSLIAISLNPVSANHGALGVVPFLVAAPTSNNPFKKNLNLDKLAKDIDIQKVLTDMELPPLELDVQLDFDITWTPSSPKPKKEKVPPVDKKATKQVKVKATATELKKKGEAIGKENSKKALAAVGSLPKPDIMSLTPRLKSKLQKAAELVAEHKYSTVVWAAVGIVWIPLFAVWLVNLIWGKECIIDILVRILPSDVSADFIERTVEDALWTGIYGIAIIATIGLVIVEMGSLIIVLLNMLESGGGDQP